ncbi:Homocysteine S-methyltransferase [Candidatus Entotheonellaceae bacterium PAL068K]
MHVLHERFERGEIVILDGATGTELQRRGVPMHHDAWCAAALLTHPEVIRQVHEDYIRAGADVIIADTFSTGRLTLESAGLGEHVQDLNRRAIILAQEARGRVAGDRPVYIAGSLSTFGHALKPGAPLDLADARASYHEQAQVLAAAGADLIILEMMRDYEHSAHAIEAAVATGLPIWVGFSCKLSEDSTQVVFLSEQEEGFAAALEALMALGGSLVAVMHTEVPHTVPALEVVQGHWHGPVGAYPHSGGWCLPHWQFEHIISPEDFLAEARQWVQMGVQLIGGCCGIGPEHIRLLKERLGMQA